MKPDAEFSTLVDALREDLPSERDSARLRAKLSALGIAASSGVTATAAAAAAAAKAGGVVGGGVGAVAQATSWSLALKVGAVAALSASVVVVPSWVVSTRSGAAQSSSKGVSSAPHGAAARPPLAANKPALNESPVEHQAEPAPLAAQNIAGRDAPPARNAKIVAQSPTAGALVATARTGAGPELPALATNEAANDTSTADDRAAAFAPQTAAQALADTTLREETRLIDGALSALRTKDTNAASALLEEHVRRYPNGLLQRERVRAQRKLDEILKVEDAP